VVADSSMETPVEWVEEQNDELKTLTIYFRKKKREYVWDKLIKFMRYFYYAKKGFSKISDTWGKPNVTHVNVIYPKGLFAWFLKSKYEIPYLCTESWTGYLTERRVRSSWMRRMLTKWAARHADFICPVTEHLQQNMINWGIQANFQVVPNVVNASVFYPDSAKKLSVIRRFLHVSTCDDAHKNISGMVRVFAQLHQIFPDLKLEIISERPVDEVHELLDSVVGNYKEFTLLFPKTNQQGVAAAMRRNDCFVIFSNYETFSVVLAESWLSGIPTVYAQCGGLTEINDARIGIQVERKNETHLYNALHKILNGDVDFDPNEITQFALAFRKEAISSAFDSLYNTMH
jgi:L-malate glycosyltransferase